MENKKITVILGNGIENVEISSNTPDISSLIKTISTNREILDTDKIQVTCDDEDFDAVGFLSVIQKAIKDFLGNILIEKKNHKDVIDQIDKRLAEKAKTQ
jgi:hypothetical protein